MGDVTVDMLRDTNGFEIGHFNFGRDGFGYECRSENYLRFTWFDRHFKGAAAKKAGKTFERTFSVDGKRVDDLDAAAVALMTPPAVTDDERAALDRLGDGWLSPREMRESVLPGADFEVRYDLKKALANKGLIECRWFPTENLELAKIKPTTPKWRRVP